MCLRKWTENTEESNEKTEADEIPCVAQAEEGHQGSGCTASVVRGGADLEGGLTASTEVEHTLTVHIHTDQEAQQRKGVVLCRRGPLFSVSASGRLVLTVGGNTDVSWLALKKGLGRKRRGGGSGGKDKGEYHGGGRGGGAVLLGQGVGGGGV